MGCFDNGDGKYLLPQVGRDKMSRYRRRKFVRDVGLSIGALAVSGCSRNDSTHKSGEVARLGELPLIWNKAPCRFCGVGCGVEVGIQDRKVVAVRGDELSSVNRGLLCAKGYHLPGILYGKDRLTQPLLKRRAGRGWDRISWPDAIELISRKFQEALDQYGPDSVGMYGSGQWTIFDGYAALKWVKGGLRSNNLEGNARLCMSSAVMGFMTQFQSDEPMGCYDDLEAADDFVLWGNNMAEMHPVLFSRILEHKRKNPGVRIIDLSTRWTPTSQYADEYIEFRPGTDLALANGVLHLLFATGRINSGFIAENLIFKRGTEELSQIGYGCFGEQGENYRFQDQPRDSSLEEVREFLSRYNPEEVSRITHIPAERIRRLADIYGNFRRKTLSLWCMGVNQHARGTWMNNLITNLHLVTGKICQPGNNPFSLTGQPSACGTVREVGTLCNRLPSDMVVTNPEHRATAEKIWNLPAGTLPSKVGYHTIDMFRALQRGDLKCLWIQTTNPWVSLPNLQRFQRTENDGRFVVVSDIYPTPTTFAADLVLPSAAWVEREGIFGNTERRTQHWDQLVEPPGEAKEDAWQIMQVAKKMGFDQLFPWPDDDWHRSMYEEYRQFTLGTGKDLASYEQLKNSRGLRWPVINGKETRYRYAAGFDPYVKKESGTHFYKAKAYGERAAFWLRPYQPPAEVPDDEYPFWLTTGRVLEHWHTGTMTRRVKELHQSVPEAYVEISAGDARDLGVQTDDRVRVISRRGEITLPVKIDARGRPPSGTVFVPFFELPHQNLWANFGDGRSDSV
jgi:nitrate reductase (cytochrome)